jgi:hypothetical protein
MLVFQAEHNILMHPFHMLGVAGVFGGSLFSAMHGSARTSGTGPACLIRLRLASRWGSCLRGSPVQGRAEKLPGTDAAGGAASPRAAGTAVASPVPAATTARALTSGTGSASPAPPRPHPLDPAADRRSSGGSSRRGGVRGRIRTRSCVWSKSGQPRLRAARPRRRLRPPGAPARGAREAPASGHPKSGRGFPGSPCEGTNSSGMVPLGASWVSTTIT